MLLWCLGGLLNQNVSFLLRKNVRPIPASGKILVLAFACSVVLVSSHVCCKCVLLMKFFSLSDV